MYDADVGEGYADIFGTLVLLDFGLDGIPAEDVNGDGDYDDDGSIEIYFFDTYDMHLRLSYQ